MRKLVQLKDINGNNLDPKNLNYEDRISDLENYEDIYSTSEVKTNKKWINGKPIYRKAYTGTTPTISEGSWTTLFAISSLSIDELIDIEGMCGTGKLPRYSNTGYFIDIQATGKNNIQVMGKGYSSQPYKITLYYTKTTD